jgi:hypothetical protein
MNSVTSHHRVRVGRFVPYVLPAIAAVIATLGILDAGGGLGIIDLMGFVLILGTSVLGVVINNHQPGNRIGILLQVAAIAILLSSLASERSVEALSDPGLWDYVSLLSESFGIFGIGALFLILFTFPDGTFLNRRWRWLGMSFIVALVTFVFFATFSEQLGDPYADEPSLANPIGFISWDTFVSAAAVAAPVILGLAISGLIAISLRFRRSGPVVRAQIKWVLYAAVAMLLAFPIAISDPSPWLEAVFFLIFFTALPITITLAITRFKLFEIDKLISRTITYAIVVATLAGAFFSLIFVVTYLVGDQSSLAVATATLGVAALFNPLRGRVQRVVDRRFNRSTFEARLVIDEFALKLLRPHSAEEVAGLLRDTVDETLQPSASAVWLRGYGSGSG